MFKVSHLSARIVRAAWGQPVDRVPVWIMRQAGRYLPEYRALRERYAFLELCRQPDLATQVTLLPLQRFPRLDAGIVFSDIMVPLLAMGIEMDFAPGPVLRHPLRNVAQIAALRVPEEQEIAPFVAQTIASLVTATDKPIIGFAGAPWTLAAYLIEGKGSKDFAHARALMYAEPAAFAQLLDKLTELTTRYVRSQIRAGAQLVQLFDSWAGLLAQSVFAQTIVPSLCRIFTQLEGFGVPRIYFATNATHLTAAMRTLPCEVLGCDWRANMATWRQLLGNEKTLQGNLDPALLLGSEAAVRAATLATLQQTTGPHIFNLGHGILPSTSIGHVEAMLEEIDTHGVGR